MAFVWTRGLRLCVALVTEKQHQKQNQAQFFFHFLLSKHEESLHELTGNQFWHCFDSRTEMPVLYTFVFVSLPFIPREIHSRCIFIFKYMKFNIPLCHRDTVGLKQNSLWIYEPAPTKCKWQQAWIRQDKTFGQWPAPDMVSSALNKKVDNPVVPQISSWSRIS